MSPPEGSLGPSVATDLPPFRPIPMSPPDVTLERRADGSMILYSNIPPAEAPRSTAHMLKARAAEHPNRRFLAQRAPGGGDWRFVTYGEADAQTDALASAFLAMGLGPDAPLLILSGNSIEQALATLAVAKVRAPAAPLSVAYSMMSSDHGKLKHCFEAVRPKAVFVQSGAMFAPALAALPLDGVPVIAVAGVQPGQTTFADLLKTPVSTGVAEEMDRIGPDTVAKYLFTSGSTGMPKPVPQTQGMMCSMIAGQEGIRDEGRDPDADPDEIPVSLDWLPWNHISGANVNFNASLHGGGTFYIDEGKPLPGLFETTIRNLSEVSPTVYGTAPIALAMLADAMEKDDALRASFFRKLRYIGYGGATLSDDLYDRLQALAIAETGKRIPITTMYGATETQGITVVHWEVERVGLVGLPLPGVTLKLVPNGTKLEVRVKGPTVMPGYHGDPEKTKKAFDEEGFYCLGDAAKFVDEADPAKGLVFDGRVTEDFKLSSGTWVSVGTLRPDLVAACSPWIHDAVIAGQDKDYAAALMWPSPAAFGKLVAAHGGDQAAAFRDLYAKVAPLVARHNAKEPGSSRRVKSFLIMTEPPSIDAGEITDKGYVNQRATLDRRADLVAALYANPVPPGVVAV